MTQTTFEQGQSQVAELVKRFSRNAATYRSPEYNETWARGKSCPRSVLKKRSERPGCAPKFCGPRLYARKLSRLPTCWCSLPLPFRQTSPEQVAYLARWRLFTNITPQVAGGAAAKL